MMMENVNYGREELMYLNMVRQGVIGDLLYGEAAYIHELRGQMKQVERGTGSWRTYHYAKRNGNVYPTHGLGPIAQYMNLARKDDCFGQARLLLQPGPGPRRVCQEKFPGGPQVEQAGLCLRRYEYLHHQDHHGPHCPGGMG